MKSTIYKISRNNEEYKIAEIKYIKWINNILYKYLDREKSIESQTIVNLVKSLYEKSKWKLWYVILDDEIIIQICDYWNDNRMCKAEFYRINRELWTEQEEEMETELDKVWEQYLSNIEEYCDEEIVLLR